MADSYEKTITADVFVQDSNSGAEPEYLYRDDLAYGQLASEIAGGGLEAEEEADLQPLDGWFSDV